jgi:uncharacterized membrane protein
VPVEARGEDRPATGLVISAVTTVDRASGASAVEMRSGATMSLDEDQPHPEVPPEQDPGTGTRGPGGDGAEPPSDAAMAHQLKALAAVHEELMRLEEAVCGGHRPITGSATRIGHATTAGMARTRDAAGHVHIPAWLRETSGESRWSVTAAILVAIGLQVALPDNLVLVSRWLLPGLELALLIGLIIASPSRFNRESTMLRATSLVLAGLLSLANAWSATLLVIGLVNGQLGQDAGPLLSTGAAIWLTNIIAFAIWYWQFDRGGPAARAHARRTLPDFQFVQMQNPELAHPDWEPQFTDYLYLSFTNATAFSPTDVMPLTRWAKLTMLVQSLVSLITVALVIARAVNILK